MEVYLDIKADDITNFGLIPEFVGRIGNIAPLEPLELKDMVSILTKPKNAVIKQYIHMFAMDDVNLEFTDKALKELAKKSMERNIGARGLNNLIEGLMTDLMFDIPSDKKLEKVIIDEEVVRGEKDPIKIYKNDNPTPPTNKPLKIKDNIIGKTDTYVKSS